MDAVGGEYASDAYSVSGEVYTYSSDDVASDWLDSDGAEQPWDGTTSSDDSYANEPTAGEFEEYDSTGSACSSDDLYFSSPNVLDSAGLAPEADGLGALGPVEGGYATGYSTSETSVEAPIVATDYADSGRSEVASEQASVEAVAHATSAPVATIDPSILPTGMTEELRASGWTPPNNIRRFRQRL